MTSSFSPLISGICSPTKATQNKQVPFLLEYLPPYSRVLGHFVEHNQHIQGVRHFEPRKEVEECVHRCHSNTWRPRSDSRGYHLGYCFEEKEIKQRREVAPWSQWYQQWLWCKVT